MLLVKAIKAPSAVVVDSLSIVAQSVRGRFVFVLCFVMQYLLCFLCLQ